MKKMLPGALALAIIMLSTTAFALTKETFKLSSSAFEDGEVIDLQYAGPGIKGGGNISLPLTWEGAPNDTVSFSISMVDLTDNNLIHWAVLNIPSWVTNISRAASPWYMPYACSELRNAFGTIGYAGPDPEKGSGPHVYEITLYALNRTIDIKGNPSFEDIRHHVFGAVMGKASIRGKFENK
ncbi:MAG: YbhB/YbcL family Raf kinase inhibitor-like protein [Candidatus Margulisiibacteriota bacterium]